MKDFLIQALPLVGLAIWTLAYQVKSRKTMLTMQFVSCTLFTIGFVLLGAITGAIITTITAIRFLVFSFKKEGNWLSKSLILWAFIVIQIICTVLTAKSGWDVFAFLGAAITTFGAWQDNPVNIRKILLPGHICWIIYDIFAGSYGAAVSEMILGLSTLISLTRKGLK